MSNEFQLKKAFWLLNNGYILHLYGGDIYKSSSNGKEYFRYRHYGESAVEATQEKLKWLFETIFKGDNYIAFQNWNDVSINFLAKDEKGMWIFTDGQFPYETEVK